MEFPKENHNGNTPLAVVPTNWIMNKNNKTVCKWPNNVQNDKAFTKLVVSREMFLHDHILCDINITYRTGKEITLTPEVFQLCETRYLEYFSCSLFILNIV